MDRIGPVGVRTARQCRAGWMWALAVATAIAAPASAIAQTAATQPGGMAAAGEQPGDAAAAQQQDAVFITIIAEERDLRAVVREVERKAGVNIYVEPGIEEVVTVRLVNLPWRQVLNVVAKDAGVEIEERSARLLILSQPPRVSMEFADADIRIVLDLLARQAGKNIVIAENVKAPVTLNLRNVHWWRALETIVKTAGYVAVQEGDDIIRVVAPSALTAQLATRVYPLLYLRPPDDYKAVISETGGTGGGTSLSGRTFLGSPAAPKGIEDFTLFQALQRMVNTAIGESVQYNNESNSFIINATATKHAEIESLLRRIDLEPQQVFIDVKFITTTNRNFWRAGLRVGDPENSPGTSGVRVNLQLSGGGVVDPTSSRRSRRCPRRRRRSSRWMTSSSGASAASRSSSARTSRRASRSPSTCPPC
jgi:type II secretory pathway component HofQ